MQTWSEAHLGQWHYVLGYLIVLGSHNWPIMLALGLSIWFGYQAYRTPNRMWVSWLITALLFGLAYEYDKHIAPALHAAVNFLFHLELTGLNRFFHLLVGPVATTLLVLAWVGFGLHALQQTWYMRRGAPAIKRNPQQQL